MIHHSLLAFYSSVTFFVGGVQSLSHVTLSETSWAAANQALLSSTISQNLLKFMSIELIMPSNHLILCRLLLLSIFPSIGVCSNDSALRIRWPKYWSSSFSISRSNEYSGLISFRIDWFDLLAVHRILKSLLQLLEHGLNLHGMIWACHPPLLSRGETWPGKAADRCSFQASLAGTGICGGAHGLEPTNTATLWFRQPTCRWVG